MKNVLKGGSCDDRRTLDSTYIFHSTSVELSSQLFIYYVQSVLHKVYPVGDPVVVRNSNSEVTQDKKPKTQISYFSKRSCRR